MSNQVTMPVRLLDMAQPPSVQAGLEQNLQAAGARMAGATLDTPATVNWLGDTFAYERLRAATPGLVEVPKTQVVFAGGACAVDPLRSAALARGLVYDPETGQAARAPDLETVCANLLGPVTLAQAMDVIGPTNGRSVAIAETTLWTSKICADLSRGVVEGREVLKKPWSLTDTDRELVQGVVGNLNQRILAVAQGIRQMLFPEVVPITVVQDSAVLPELTERTYALYRELGFEVDGRDTNIPVLGMYTAAWRETLLSQGLLNADDVLAIYEPTRHMGVAKDNARKTTMVQTMLAKYPYLRPGYNQQVGVLTYVESQLPSGLALSTSVPPALQPNSANVGRFDFSRYPILEQQKGKGALGMQEFRYLEKIGNLNLTKNPAFLWAVTAFPPTWGLVAQVREMVRIAQESNQYVADRRKGEWQMLPAAEQNARSAAARDQASQEMQAAAEKVIGMLEMMSETIFGIAAKETGR